jgi:hypothetical protein
MVPSGGSSWRYGGCRAAILSTPVDMTRYRIRAAAAMSM